MMKSDRVAIYYLKWFAFPVLTFFMIAVPLSIFFGPVTGDLTRVGHWSERDYGGNQPQPDVHVRSNRTVLPSPQVLVLGDSFSHPNIWQSHLAELRNLTILSFQYQDVGCIDNWLKWVAGTPSSSVGLVIIQVVERSFVPLFRSIKTCSNRAPKPLEIAEKKINATLGYTGLTLDADYLIPTAANTLRMAWTDGRLSTSGVINAPLTTGKLFSNHKSNRLLYYEEDESKLSWSEKDITAAVANLKRIQNDLAEKKLRLLLVVVPDKSSVYRQYLIDKESKNEYPNIFEQLKVTGVNDANLLGFFQQAVRETVDLYLPNDTHLSGQGYKLMATKVAAAIE
jgi:hypothetical protein